MDTDRVRSACSETLVISLLREGRLHGYDMCKEIERRSGGYFTLKHSTLYPLLHRLEQQGLVRSEWGAFEGGKPRKYYELTRKGARYHEENVASWRELLASLAVLVPEVAP